MELRTIPIRKTGHRANLTLGADREMIMFSGLVAFSLIVQAQDYRATIFGLVMWFGSLFCLRLAAKSDPKMRDVYIRHLKYKGYYPARSTPFRVDRRNRKRGWS